MEANKENQVKVEINSKKMLKDLADRKKKIRLNDRKKLEILKDSGFYKKGQIIEPHSVFADELIKKKIAKEV